MLDQLRDRLAIPEISQAEAALQAKDLKIVYLISAAGSALMLLFIPEFIRANPAYFLATVLYHLAWPVLCLPGFFMLRRGQVWVSALWLAFTIYLYVSYTIFMTDGMQHSFLSLFLLFTLLITSWYLGRRATVLFILLTGFSSVGLYWVQYSGWLAVLLNSDPRIVSTFLWIIFFFLFSFILLEYIRAMTERQRQLRLSAEQLALLHDIDVGILAAKSIPDIVRAAVQPLQHLAPSCAGSIAFFDLPQGEMYFLSQSGDVPHGPRVKIEDLTLVSSLSQGQTVIYPDLRLLSPISRPLAIIRDNGNRSVVGVPIIVQHELLGVLGLFSTEPDMFTPDHVRVVQQVAASLAVAIQSSRLLEAERIARRQAETLREVADILNTNLDQGELLDLILEQLAYVIPYDQASILLKTGDSWSIVARRGDLASVDYQILAQVPMLPNIRRVMASGAPHIIPDTQQDPAWVTLRGEEAMRCWMGVPMIIHGELIGLLGLDKVEPYFYQASDERLALAFANQAAIAIENGRLYHELQQHAHSLEQRVMDRMRDLTVLFDVAAITREYGELEPLLNSAIEAVLNSLDCFAGAIYLLGDDDVLHLLNERGVPHSVRPHIVAVAVDNELIRPLLADEGREAFIVRDMARTMFGPLFGVTQGEMTCALVAMRTKGQLMGILMVAKQCAGCFTAEQLALLGSIGDHVAVMIENGRLHHHAQQVAVMQERERLARVLHDSVTQSLYGLTLFAEAANELAQAGQIDRARIHLQQIGQTALQALREMRLMLYELRSTTLLEEGLVHALRYRLENVEERANIETSLTVSQDLCLPADVEEGLYRVSQEALNNIIKHARARRVDLALEQEGTTVTLTITDNGRGFSAGDGAPLSDGLGLAMMHKQVERFGGILTLGSQKGQGTTIQVSVDLLESPVRLSAPPMKPGG